ncbi:MAG: hypothetical protein LBU47_08025 [Christensenellaceae bacterium]|jgi:hypothetical protein|nr:hypothetical protein [Christensenellaceae bacterium]
MKQGRSRVRTLHGNAHYFWLGLGLAVLSSLGLIVLFALAIQFFSLDSGSITPVNQFIKVLSILLGVLAVRKAPISLSRLGAQIGFAYMALGILSYCAASLKLLPALAILGDLALGLCAGTLSGLLVGSFKKAEG